MLLILNNLCITVLFLLLQLSARSAQLPAAPDFAELTSSTSGKSRQSPPRINCSDCKQHLTKRIRQMQHLQRMKQRIMSAIRSNGNHVPAVDNNPRSSPPGGSDRKGLEPQRPRGVMGSSNVGASLRNASDTTQRGDSGSSIGNKQRSDRQQSVGHEASRDSTARGQRRVSTNGRTWKREKSRKQRQGRRKLLNPKMTNATDANSHPSIAKKNNKNGPPRETLIGPGNARLRGSNDDKKKDAYRADMIETQGPNIVSFSRVVSSGKRKHVLQFTLTPAVHGEDLEVVKAHLWLLLTRHRSRGDHAEVKVGKDKVKVEKAKVENDTHSGEVKVNQDRSQGNHSEAEAIAEVKVGKEGGNETEVKAREEKQDIKERQKRSLSSLNSPNEKQDGNRRKAINDKRQDRSSNNDKQNNHKNKDKKDDKDEVDEDDDDDDDENDEEEDERFQAVLRVLLLADNGTRTLMTYLRTNVKVRHWQKIRLPVSVIQQQLQSSRSTLTLLIRCRRCGDAVRMVLPRQARSRRKDRRRRRKRKHGIGKQDSRSGRKVRHQRHKKSKKKRRRRRRHGERGGERRRSMVTASPTSRQRKQFHPLPFLVINTRIRKSRKALIV